MLSVFTIKNELGNFEGLVNETTWLLPSTLRNPDHPDSHLHHSSSDLFWCPLGRSVHGEHHPHGNKHHINPHSVLPQYGSSDLVILDSSCSTFYSLSLTNPEEKMVKKLPGRVVVGYADGELGFAKFNKPNSFAVDFRGNLYVADKLNHAIRKISKSEGKVLRGKIICSSAWTNVREKMDPSRVGNDLILFRAGRL